MPRKYDDELLEKLIDQVEVVREDNTDIILKKIPDCDEVGVIDPRFYKSLRWLVLLMKIMPKFILTVDSSPDSITKMRHLFAIKRSSNIVRTEISITNTNILDARGTEAIPIRIYKPQGILGPMPVLYFMHGGGFFGGSLDVVEEFIKLICEKTGCMAVSIDYRLAPENPYPIGHEDCYSGLKWINKYIHKFGGDHNNIFVCGDSAGGNLAQYCTTKDYEADTNLVKGQILIYPTLNIAGVFDQYYQWDLSQFEIDEKYEEPINMMLDVFKDLKHGAMDVLSTEDVANRYISPYLMDKKIMVPTLITAGEHDYLKVEAIAYAKKLSNNGVDVKTIIYKGLSHGYIDYVGYLPQAEDFAREVSMFIKHHVK